MLSMHLLRMVIVSLAIRTVPVTENTPSSLDGVHSGENVGISKVDCCQYGMDTSKTAQPWASGCVGDCGISDHVLADCARMMATAVVHQGIFEDAFSDEWTEPEPEFHTHIAIIDHIIQICDFPADSDMVEYIEQQQWLTLAHVVSVGLEEVEEFFTVKWMVLPSKQHQC
jgi:hypothetical protein